MGDDVRYGATCVLYAFAHDDGTWSEPMELGEATAFDMRPSDEEMERWGRVLADVSVHMSFRVAWWSINRTFKLMGLKPPYTVRGLRRGGKSHRRLRSRR